MQAFHALGVSHLTVHFMIFFVKMLGLKKNQHHDSILLTIKNSECTKQLFCFEML